MKVQATDLMNAKGVARLTGLTPARITQLANDPDSEFPDSLHTPDVLGIRLFLRTEVEDWLRYYRARHAHDYRSKFGPKKEKS